MAFTDKNPMGRIASLCEIEAILSVLSLDVKGGSAYHAVALFSGLQRESPENGNSSMVEWRPAPDFGR